MVYITGDLHGNYNQLLNIKEKHHLQADDTLVVLGDFGFIFYATKHEKSILNQLNTLGFEILFIDGNHENFNLLNAYPVTTYKGGKAHLIGNHVFHLMRGEVFTIENKRFFCFGGAYSRDSQRRILNQDWWSQELPNAIDYETALSTLQKHGNSMDYMLTHQAPRKIIKELGRLHPCEVPLCNFFDILMERIDYKQWFFGHWHTDKEFEHHKMTAVYTGVWQI